MAFEKRHRELAEQADQMFSGRLQLMHLMQDIAENFYPERADFTLIRNVGADFSGWLDTSYPVLARRDLGNAFGAMLRPPGKPWFHIGPKRDEGIDDAGRKWLEMAERVERRAMYDRSSGFARATKEADHDFAAFGQAILSSEVAYSPQDGKVLLHRSWHFRDVAWEEDALGRISTIARRWKIAARELVNLFPRTVADQVRNLARDEPFHQVDCLHVIVASHNYERKFKQPWVSVYLDTENQAVLEEIGSWSRYYIIPRWQTGSGSQYAYSPAVVAALGDARLIQAMTYTLITASEVAVNPPMIGVTEAIKGGIETFPGGFTAVDAQYDERLGEVLRPLHKGGEKNIPVGLEMTRDVRAMIGSAFYLDKLSLPSAGLGGMSPLEVSQRIEEYIRTALPLFEPMESDYNGPLCEQDFNLLLREGAFGPAENIPESLRGQEVEFRFESPLREAVDRIKGQQFLESKALLAEAAQLDPIASQMIDARTALRDALHGIGTPARWLRGEEELAQLADTAAKSASTQMAMGAMQTGAQVAEQVGKAGQALRAAVAPDRESAAA